MIATRPGPHPRTLDLANSRPSFPDAAGCEDSLIPARTDNHGVNFVTVFYNHEVCDNGGAAIGEINRESTGAIGVHGVSAGSWSVGEVGDHVTVDGDGVGLCEPALSVKVGHRDAHLWTDRSRACQFRALNE